MCVLWKLYAMMLSVSWFLATDSFERCAASYMPAPHLYKWYELVIFLHSCGYKYKCIVLTSASQSTANVQYTQETLELGWTQPQPLLSRYQHLQERCSINEILMAEWAHVQHILLVSHEPPVLCGLSALDTEALPCCKYTAKHNVMILLR